MKVKKTNLNLTRLTASISIVLNSVVYCSCVIAAHGGVTDGGSLVNTVTTFDQLNPRMTMDADADFVIDWNDVYDVGKNDGGYAQYCEDDGETVDLQIVVRDDVEHIVRGYDYTYTIITTNVGTDVALDLNLSAMLPTGVNYVTHDGGDWGCVERHGSMICYLSAFDAGSHSSVSVTVSSEVAFGELSYTVSVFSEETDMNSDDNSDIEKTLVVADGMYSSP